MKWFAALLLSVTVAHAVPATVKRAPVPAIKMPMPPYDAKWLASLETEVTALVADKADCAKVAVRARTAGPLFDAIRNSSGRPATSHDRIAELAMTVLSAGTTCAKQLDRKAVWDLAVSIELMVRELAAPASNPPAFEKLPPPKSIDGRDKQLLAAEDFVLAVAPPEDFEVPAAKLRRGQIFRRAFRYADAVAIFIDIVDNHRTHEAAEYAANLALDSLNVLQRYDELIALAKRLYADKKFIAEKDELGVTLQRIVHTAAMKETGECDRKARETNDRLAWRACGEKLIAIYNDAQESADAGEVLFDAMVMFDRGGNPRAVVRLATLIHKWFPKSKEWMHAIGYLWRGYATLGMHRNAAETLEDYATKFPAEKDAVEALSNATYYRLAIGDLGSAIANAKTAQKTFFAKQPSEAAAIQLSMLAVYEDDGNDVAVIKVANDYLATYGSKGGTDREIIVRARLGIASWHRACASGTRPDGAKASLQAAVKRFEVTTSKDGAAARAIDDANRALGEIASGTCPVAPPPSTDALPAPTISSIPYELAKADGGWTIASCAGSSEAGTWDTASSPDPALAYFKTGFANHMCGRLDAAERAYRQALGIKADHAPSLANLAAIQHRAGNLAVAKATWERALAADPNLSAAHVGLAAMQLREIRATPDPAIVKSIEDHLAAALGSWSDNAYASMMFGMLHTDGVKLHLRHARLFFDELERVAPADDGSIANARAVWLWQSGRTGEATAIFETLAPKHRDAALNLAFALLRAGKTGDAKIWLDRIEPWPRVANDHARAVDAIKAAHP